MPFQARAPLFCRLEQALDTRAASVAVRARRRARVHVKNGDAREAVELLLDVAEAHAHMETNTSVGKILLGVGPD